MKRIFFLLLTGLMLYGLPANAQLQDQRSNLAIGVNGNKAN